MTTKTNLTAAQLRILRIMVDQNVALRPPEWAGERAWTLDEEYLSNVDGWGDPLGIDPATGQQITRTRKRPVWVRKATLDAMVKAGVIRKVPGFGEQTHTFTRKGYDVAHAEWLRLKIAAADMSDGYQAHVARQRDEYRSYLLAKTYA